MERTRQRLFLPFPAVPANSATVVLFTTADRLTGGAGALVRNMLPSGVEPSDVDSVTITFVRHNKASATNGLKAYSMAPSGTWYETDLKDDDDVASFPKSIPALTSGQEWRETLILSHVKDKCIEYTAGSDNPEDWDGWVVVDLLSQAVQR